MSITETQTLLAFLPCIVIVSTAAVYLGKYKPRDRSQQLIMEKTHHFILYRPIQLCSVVICECDPDYFVNYIAPLRNYNNGGSEAKSGYEQSLGNGPARPPRNLGSNDIVKLLDDLDNQTEAIKNGQEIGDGLLNGKNQTTTKEQKMNWRENSSTGMLYFTSHQTPSS